jgi:hypothetical protein
MASVDQTVGGESVQVQVRPAKRLLPARRHMAV